MKKQNNTKIFFFISIILINFPASLTSKQPVSIIIHGGVKNIHSKKLTRYNEALKKIIEQGYKTLQKEGGRKALVHVIELLENNRLFNAGTGSRLQRDGEARMSAALMSGTDNIFAATINIKNVKNPIQVANILFDQRYKVLCGNPATKFARAHRILPHNTKTKKRIREHRQKKETGTGTVGAVIRDSAGNLWVGTSTGGTGYETPGRAGDSATVAGTYASKHVGVSCTGKGEDIINQAVAAKIATLVDCGISLSNAKKKIISTANELGYTFGFIALDKQGRVEIGKTNDHIVLFATHDGKKIKTFLS